MLHFEIECTYEALDIFYKLRILDSAVLTEHVLHFSEKDHRMSHTMVPLNIVSALKKVQEFLGGERHWLPVSKTQRQFLDGYVSHTDTLSMFGEKELRTWADTVAANLNAILKQEGFTIHLDDFAPGAFGVVSILDVLVEWLKKGELSQVRGADGVTYPAVESKHSALVDDKHCQLFTTWTSEAHQHPIATMASKSGDRLSMTIAGSEYADFALMDRINEIRAGTTRDERYERLRFPMVDYDNQTDLSWLCGLSSFVRTKRGDPYVVEKALQQTKFKMNQHGARLKDAVAMVMRGISMPRILTIDRPFFLWIDRPGVPVPVMYAYCDEQDWKDPGRLDNM